MESNQSTAAGQLQQYEKLAEVDANGTATMAEILPDYQDMVF